MTKQQKEELRDWQRIQKAIEEKDSVGMILLKLMVGTLFICMFIPFWWMILARAENVDSNILCC